MSDRKIGTIVGVALLNRGANGWAGKD
jgi:hypothetical protein